MATRADRRDIFSMIACGTLERPASTVRRAGLQAELRAEDGVIAESVPKRTPRGSWNLSPLFPHKAFKTYRFLTQLRYSEAVGGDLVVWPIADHGVEPRRSFLDNAGRHGIICDLKRHLQKTKARPIAGLQVGGIHRSSDR